MTTETTIQNPLEAAKTDLNNLQLRRDEQAEAIKRNLLADAKCEAPYGEEQHQADADSLAKLDRDLQRANARLMAAEEAEAERLRAEAQATLQERIAKSKASGENYTAGAKKLVKQAENLIALFDGVAIAQSDYVATRNSASAAYFATRFDRQPITPEEEAQIVTGIGSGLLFDHEKNERYRLRDKENGAFVDGVQAKNIANQALMKVGLEPLHINHGSPEFEMLTRLHGIIGQVLKAV